MSFLNSRQYLFKVNLAKKLRESILLLMRYLLLTDSDVLQLYVPKYLKPLFIKQYHDDNGHMGVQKPFDCTGQKYFWPNLFTVIYQYVSNCTICQI